MDELIRPIEQNNRVLRPISDRPQKDDGNGIPHVIIARDSFLTNLIRRSKVISAIQLARGYMPYIMGRPLHLLSVDLLNAHIGRESVRALEIIIRSKASDKIDPAHLPPEPMCLLITI